MRSFTALLVIFLLLLQYKLWIGNGSFSEAWRLSRDIAAQQEENARLKVRNQALAAEVNDLKLGTDAIEERARSELGMIRDGETFYQIVER